jgi:hypothetical protein
MKLREEQDKIENSVVVVGIHSGPGKTSGKATLHEPLSPNKGQGVTLFSTDSRRYAY